MIDNPGQAERLLIRLQAALPMPARMTPELAATLRTPDTAMEIPAACSIIAVHYAGDEGGIVCGLDVAAANDKAVYASITHLRFDPRLPVARDIAANDKAVYASITHLRFDPRLPVARDIAAYQKHRVKRLRRQPTGPG